IVRSEQDPCSRTDECAVAADRPSIKELVHFAFRDADQCGQSAGRLEVGELIGAPPESRKCVASEIGPNDSIGGWIGEPPKANIGKQHCAQKSPNIDHGRLGSDNLHRLLQYGGAGEVEPVTCRLRTRRIWETVFFCDSTDGAAEGGEVLFCRLDAAER